jgi:hypothetical protein
MSSLYTSTQGSEPLPDQRNYAIVLHGSMNSGDVELLRKSVALGAEITFTNGEQISLRVGNWRLLELPPGYTPKNTAWTWFRNLLSRRTDSLALGG